MMTRHHILLLCGLGSSVIRRYHAWATKMLAPRLRRHYGERPDIVIHTVSSDGSGEAPAQRAVLADHRAGRLGTVVGGGHSNGGRDGALTCDLFADAGIKIPYWFVVDMTLDNRVPFGAGIDQLDEFWAGLARARTTGDFTGRHTVFDLDKIEKRNVGHVESARLAIVQDRIFSQVVARIA